MFLRLENKFYNHESLRVSAPPRTHAAKCRAESVYPLIVRSLPHAAWLRITGGTVAWVPLLWGPSAAAAAVSPMAWQTWPKPYFIRGSAPWRATSWRTKLFAVGGAGRPAHGDPAHGVPDSGRARFWVAALAREMLCPLFLETFDFW